ncbi:MAG: hypothetical protein APF76_01690 [Desulfitibacter sp. BRH_c19]|nr:MAG: hypothetical protein APF76_01690 [Desulfitibacter sp. BRH_c19]
MTLLQLEILKTVVETGSFTKAGEVLSLSQSAVSHAIASLEEELEISLLHRSRTGVTLTYAGEQLIINIRAVLNHTRQIEYKAAKIIGHEIGKIRVGSFLTASTELFPGMVKQFKSIYPKIEVELFEGGYDDITEWISSGVVDIGFVILPNKSFDIVSVISDEYVVILPQGHPLEDRDTIELIDIANEPFIMPLAGCEFYIEPLFSKYKVRPNIQFKIEHTATIIALVNAGMGISIVPSLSFKPPGIVSVKLKTLLQRNIGLAVSSFKLSSPATKAFLAQAKIWSSKYLLYN